MTHDIDPGGPPLRTGLAFAEGSDSFATAARAAMTAVRALGDELPRIVFVHHAPCHDSAAVLRGARSVAPGALVLGCSTEGPFCGELRRDGITVTALASPHLRGAVGLARNAASGWSAALDEALAAPALAALLDASPEASRRRVRKGSRRFAIVYAPGECEELASPLFEVVEALRFRTLGRVPVFAAAVGDGPTGSPGSVFAGDEVACGGLLVLIIETELEFGISLAHGFRASGNAMRVDAAEGRELLLVDGCAASHVLGASSSLRGLSSLDHITLSSGKAFGIPERPGEFAISVASHPTTTGGVRMSRPVQPGSELVGMELVRDAASGGAAEAAGKALLRAGSSPAGLVMVHYCALRASILGEEGARAELARIRELAGQAPLAGILSRGTGVRA